MWAFKVEWVEVGAGKDGPMPFDDEGIEGFEVSESGIDRESVGFLVSGHGEDGVGVSSEHAGAADSVDRLLLGLVTFGVVGAESDRGTGLDCDSFQLVAEGSDIPGLIFVSISEGFIDGIDDYEDEFTSQDLGDDFFREILDPLGMAAQIPCHESILG